MAQEAAEAAERHCWEEDVAHAALERSKAEIVTDRFSFLIKSQIRLHLILLYMVSYLHILSYSSLDLCIMLCMLPPPDVIWSSPSSTMMS